MARPLRILRIELSGGLYHVTSRGDRREEIYFSEVDRHYVSTAAATQIVFQWLLDAEKQQKRANSYPPICGEIFGLFSFLKSLSVQYRPGTVSWLLPTSILWRKDKWIRGI